MAETLVQGPQVLQVIQNTSLKIEALQSFPTKMEDKGQLKQGYFVSMPKELTRVLPGSEVFPKEFVEHIYNREVCDGAWQNLVSNHLSCGDCESCFNYVSDNKKFGLTVFHGSFNPKAIEIIKLADKNDHESYDARAKYQGNIVVVMHNVLKEPNHLGKYPRLRIIEDCIASGDSIMGILALLKSNQLLKDMNLKSSVRIDVAVATPQGVMILKKFAQDNDLNLDINIGYLAYGLTQGELQKDGTREHSNYMYIPKNLASYISGDNEVRSMVGQVGVPEKMVAGDMGLFFKSLPDEEFGLIRCAWNRYREDEHGERNQYVPRNNNYDPKKITNLFLANGGYFMEALFKYKNKSDELLKTINLIMLRASRRDDQKKGYGVFCSTQL